MHWGKDESVGSEHLIDGKSYAGEVRKHGFYWINIRLQKNLKFSLYSCILLTGIQQDTVKHPNQFNQIATMVLLFWVLWFKYIK